MQRLVIGFPALRAPARPRGGDRPVYTLSADNKPSDLAAEIVDTHQSGGRC